MVATHLVSSEVYLGMAVAQVAFQSAELDGMALLSEVYMLVGAF